MVAMGPPVEPPYRFGELLVVERGRLLEELRAVAGAGWQKPTPCPGWSVHALCCHLVGDDVSLLSRHRDGYHGTVPPAGLDEQGFIGWLDDLQAEWVHAARRLSPRLIVELLQWAGPQLAAVLSGQDAGARTARVSWAGPDPVPVWLDHVRELSEYWIHRQQLRQALGHDPDLRPDLAVPVLDGLRWAYPFRLGKVRAERGDTLTLSVHGPATITWHLVAGPAGWAFRDAPGRRLVAQVSMTTDQAWRLLTNNLPAGHLRQLQVSGDPQITGMVLRTRAIIGAPK